MFPRCDYFLWRSEFQPPLPPGQQLDDYQLNMVLGLAMNNISWLALDPELLALRSKTAADTQTAIRR